MLMLVASGSCASQAPNQQVCSSGSARSSRPLGPERTGNASGAAPWMAILSSTTVSGTVPSLVVSPRSPTAVHGTASTSSQAP